MPAPTLVDTHVHVWDVTGGPSGVTYPWLTSGPLHRTHTLAEVEPAMREVGVDAVVLVQASDSLAETDELLRVARRAGLPASVVGWLPLADPDGCRRELERRTDPRLVGVRHLIHDEADPQWMLRPDVAAGMRVLDEAGLTFDAVAERPDLLAQVPVVARRHPNLTIVLDHLGKPPVRSGWAGEAAQRWAQQLRDVAAAPSTVAKMSGLELAWGGAGAQEAVRPFLQHALDCFGSDRLMLGSDWPVSTLRGDYADVMGGLRAALDRLTPQEQTAIRSGTAQRVYGTGA
ncbi:amidohydrolase family protein [Cellulomonas aerilata]|uniref:Metal-dependent hydrolase n=1 Tax=Cellulomonas aerilata TaxID=515326 RepID=A0A512DCF7_9CELL|nr:amidohydrolase family protein [Cellulomonas aerilata]GEO34169.1 metal-dependent hydrolase [Cellulomonas aerilata]